MTIILEIFQGFKMGMFASVVGAANAEANDFFTTLTQESALFAYGCGGGTNTSAGGVGTSSDFAEQSPQAVFLQLFGSYFGDYDTTDNLMRASLASAGAGLTVTWSGRPNWNYHSLAMGESMATAVLHSQRAGNGLYSDSGHSIHGVHLRW